MKHIGVYTSGGDAPGMNAAIRAVVRYALFQKIDITGIRHGYQGMLDGEAMKLKSNDMANLLKNGGTALKSARCQEFLQPEARKKAADFINSLGINGLICIGGDGSFRGAQLLSTEHQIPLVGIPATIDNDIPETDQTIGFDTATNTVVNAIDRIRDTADAHDRLFIIEVMGRDSGFLALDAGLAGGAEEIFFSDNPVTVEQAIDHVRRSMARGKRSSILITAEGHKPGRAYDLADSIRMKANLEARVCVLGHVQRGGAPTAADRILASRMGIAAVDALIGGQTGVMLADKGRKIVSVAFSQIVNVKKNTPRDLIRLAQILSA